MKPDSTTKHLTYHVDHTVTQIWGAHARNALCWISRGASSRKSFFICESTGPPDTSFLGGSIRQIAWMCINASCHAKNVSTCLYFFLSSSFSPLLSQIVALLIVASTIDERIWGFIDRKIPYCPTDFLKLRVSNFNRANWMSAANQRR